MTERRMACVAGAGADLFGAPVLPGLDACDAFVGEAEEAALIAEIDAADLSSFRFQGWEGKRLTTSFGWTWDFDRARPVAGEPLPGWLLPFRNRAACFAGVPVAALVQALLMRYDPGAGIGWHRDWPMFGHVIAVPPGAPATPQVRRCCFASIAMKRSFFAFAAIGFHLPLTYRHPHERA